MDEKTKQPSRPGDDTLWPGEGLRKAGEEIKGENGEETKIPEIRNDCKKYNGPAES